MNRQKKQVITFNISVPEKVPPWIDSKARTAKFTEDGITITSNFPCGNGQYFTRTAPYCYSFRARVARQRFTYRFYLKIESSGAKRDIRLRALDFKMYDPPLKKRETAAMFSNDNKTWQPVPPKNISVPNDCRAEDADCHDAGGIYCVEYILKPERFPVWVATPLPYTVENLAALINDAVEKLCATATVIGRTPQGLDTVMIAVKHPGAASGHRKKVFVVGGQHPSEVSGILAVEGMVRELIIRPELCRTVSFYFIPLADMDGFFFGRTRANCIDEAGCNLNDDAADLSQVETRNIFRTIQSVQPDVFIDCHNGRGWDEYRLQGFLPTQENKNFVAKVKTYMESERKEVLIIERPAKGLSSEEVVRRKLAPVGFVYENLLTVEPSRENYLAGGRILLYAVLNALGKE